MVLWTVIANHNSGSEGLGEFLAHRVPGEWVEEPGVAQNRYHLLSEGTEGLRLRWPMARALAQYLLIKSEVEWLKMLLNRHYRTFSQSEVEHIMIEVARSLHSDRMRDQARLDLATTLIFRWLEDHTTLVLEGIRTFLLPEIVQEFSRAIDEAVDLFLMEEEYQEFVKLLKQLVSVAGGKHDWIHVRFHQGRFSFEDPSGMPLGEDLLDDMLAGLERHKEPLDDILISALVTLAPKRITLHRGSLLPEGMYTLKEVFDHRVLSCSGCARCYSSEVDSDRRSF